MNDNARSAPASGATKSVSDGEPVAAVESNETAGGHVPVSLEALHEAAVSLGNSLEEMARVCHDRVAREYEWVAWYADRAAVVGGIADDLKNEEASGSGSLRSDLADLHVTQACAQLGIEPFTLAAMCRPYAKKIASRTGAGFSEVAARCERIADVANRLAEQRKPEEARW